MNQTLERKLEQKMSKAVKAANESGHDLPVLFFRHSKCLNDYKGNPEDIKVDMPFLIKPAREALSRLQEC